MFFFEKYYMKCIDNYINTKIELNSLINRLELITQQEKDILVEKDMINKAISHYTKIIKIMEEDICNLSGIENKLYKEIVINGTTVSKSIEKISIEENKDVSTLWKNYYPNVKKKIEKLSNIKNLN